MLKGLSRGRKSIWAAIAALLLLAATLGSVLGARAVARSDAQKAQLAFHLASAEIASTLKLSIQHEEDLVVSASAFVTSNPNASPADFDRWAESVRAMQRYPELENIGFVTLVPSRALAAFEARFAANPVRPLGPNSVGIGSFQVLPPGPRSFYCFAVAGLARSPATYIPAGMDYCSLAPALMEGRNTGVASYAPVVDGRTASLGISTPMYSGGVAPATEPARRRAFIGWLGELLAPNVVLERALEGHPNIALLFGYDAGSQHVSFAAGKAPADAQRATISLRNGWTMQAAGAVDAPGVFGNWHALTLLIGGTMLSLLFGLLVFVLGTGRRRALAMVNEKTRELSHQALHDTLTGLPNRALVLDRAEQMLARTARQPGIVAGALFVDIDGFKHVNDSLGHAAGDQLLRVVGERLQEAVREEDTVGRLGGDEFVVLVETSRDQATLDVFADRLTEVLREPVKLADGRTIFSVTASIGVAVGQRETPDALLRDADLALYAAKAAGKDRYALFEPGMHGGVEGRLELEADLNEAVQEGQFMLFYQPIFNVPGREVIGAEALIRWQHPVRGLVPPDSFIPLAEESGLIIPLGRWVLEEACRQAAAWAADGLAIGVSVNVSAHQLGRRGFVEDVRRALGESRIKPSSLTLEITETTLMRNVPSASEHLEEVRGLGVRVAIDDFGTGYASLSHLQRVPVDILKIDRSFVTALNEGDQSRELLAAILGVGQALSLAVVVEGVEEESQMSTLQEMGCQMVQGFLLAKPGPPEAVEHLFGSGASGAVGSQAA